jgi:hypothetical protein
MPDPLAPAVKKIPWEKQAPDWKDIVISDELKQLVRSKTEPRTARGTG